MAVRVRKGWPSPVTAGLGNVPRWQARRREPRPLVLGTWRPAPGVPACVREHVVFEMTCFVGSLAATDHQGLFRNTGERRVDGTTCSGTREVVSISETLQPAAQRASGRSMVRVSFGVLRLRDTFRPSALLPWPVLLGQEHTPLRDSRCLAPSWVLRPRRPRRGRLRCLRGRRK